MNWKDLDDITLLDILEERSKEKADVIFKHSTRCGVSSMVLKSLNRQLQGTDFDHAELYFLDLIKYRDISNRIAQQWNVEHQSPQLIVLEGGSVSNHASHYSIDAALFSKV